VFSLQFAPEVPLVAVGAPAASYYPQVARGLGVQLVLPPFADVANAVGAVLGQVSQRVHITVSQPVQGVFRVFTHAGPRDFNTVASAISHAQALAAVEATARATEAGAASARVEFSQEDNQVSNDIDGNMFFEARVTATASGPPVTKVSTPSRLALQEALSAHGLCLRGGWQPAALDALAALPDGRPAAVVWMVGVVGSAFWPSFKASSFYQDGLADPLDRWSRAIGSELARRWGGVALFPFEGPPYHPFQQWATRAEPLQTSPLMLRIHPEYGLWHAYRFALALPAVLPGDLFANAVNAVDSVAPATASPDLCLSCSGQPCLTACPVQAFTGTTYKLDACATHLHAPQGEACMQSGCLARRACPVGQAHRYTPEHAAFHMTAFAGRH
jgi:hypothetical protein